jgi:hypothetical protein
MFSSSSLMGTERVYASNDLGTIVLALLSANKIYKLTSMAKHKYTK